MSPPVPNPGMTSKAFIRNEPLTEPRETSVMNALAGDESQCQKHMGVMHSVPVSSVSLTYTRVIQEEGLPMRICLRQFSVSKPVEAFS